MTLFLPLLAPARRSVAVFSTRDGLGIASPPYKPPTPLRFGSYCFRATCQIFDESQRGCPVAKVKGYDRSPQIAADTEEVCRAHVRMTGDGGIPLRCSDAEVVLLPATDMECSGQIMLVKDGSVRRLV